jgi:1-acyl-sn-glycerol-3-phosphate acyltransferase
VRTALAWIIAVPWTVVMASLAIIIAFGSGGRRRALALTHLWARVLVLAAGGRLRVEGLDAVDPACRYVVMVNHSSAFDIPVIIAALPASLELSVWAKRSLFRIPFLGWSMTRMGFVPVDRDDRTSAGPMLRRSLALVADGRSVLVFPEETYGPEDDLLPFQRGGFLLALKSGLPILPVGIEGARAVLPPRRHTVRPGRVTVRIGTAVPTAELVVTDRRRIMDQTRAEILALSGLSG